MNFYWATGVKLSVPLRNMKKLILVIILASAMPVSVGDDEPPKRRITGAELKALAKALTLRDEICSKHSFFIESKGEILEPFYLLDGTYDHERDSTISKAIAIVRLYKSEYLHPFTHIKNWFIILSGWLGLTTDGVDWAEINRYRDFINNNTNLAQYLNEIAHELCPKEREYCGKDKHYSSKFAARHLRLLAPSLWNNETSYLTYLEPVVGAKYFEKCLGFSL